MLVSSPKPWADGWFGRAEDFFLRDYDAHCIVQDGTIRCDTCGKVADTIHFIHNVVVPYPDKPRRIEAACPDHDPGGYWIRISHDLIDEAWDTIHHLSQKRGMPHVALIHWLGWAGCNALDNLRLKGNAT